MPTKFGVGIMEGKDTSVGMDISGRIILKRIFRE
jgi:hypothetical protein